MRRSIGLEEPGAPGIEITRMKRRHIRGVMAIERRVYPRPWTPSLFISEITAGRTRCYLVALADAKVVGYGGLMCYGDEAHVTNIAVDPAWHRHKIGTRLLLTLMRQALARSCRNVTLEVRVSNTGAQAMYRRFGFAPAGVRRKYYESVEDAIVMWCHDIGSDEHQARLALLERSLPGATTWEGIR
jgi:ribosomal-protein-alanine N-acetyltransferase